MSYSLKELRELPTDELIRQHDHAAETASVGVNYFLEEIARRHSAEQTERIIALTEQMAASTRTVEKLTRVIVGLTVVVALLTAASLVAVINAA
jgi:hypothetical protein